MIKKSKITSSNRWKLLLTSLILFGVILGADPNPMGTVKDAITLFADKGVIFPPRLIAFIVFTLMVIFANKFICSWGCQFGTLQDLIFELAKGKKREKPLLKPKKLSFALTNSIRIISLVVLAALAFAIGMDIVGIIDPFKIFHPTMIGIAAGIFIFLILALSTFIYRPWCHLFCPFGLTGWLAENFSFNRIQIKTDKCTKCRACTQACPSLAMDAILDGKNIKPDCFSCARCIEVCPENAICFGKKIKTESSEISNV
ncbi:MAG: 4Fe-4S binding protein [Phycisphaerae bacterium]|nr:4Fe-4S binding protein [Phycisphaerae bacterium]